MIDFFRKIRRKHISQKNARKYFVYAIGEILLIVIGILIALQVNNWNLERKTGIFEKQVLQGIHSDLVADSTSIERRIPEQVVDLANSVKIYDSLLRLNESVIDIKVIDSIFERCTRERNTFWPKSGTYNSIVSSGQISVISNQDLIKEIQSLYDVEYRRLDDFGHRIDDLSEKLKYELSVDQNAKFDEKLSFYRNPKTINKIHYWKSRYETFQRRIYEIRMRNHLLIDEIKEELQVL